MEQHKVAAGNIFKGIYQWNVGFAGSEDKRLRGWKHSQTLGYYDKAILKLSQPKILST